MAPWLNGSMATFELTRLQIIICKLSHEKEDSTPCEVIGIIRDNDVRYAQLHHWWPRPICTVTVPNPVANIGHKDTALNCCCTWSKDVKTGRPLLCVAGKDCKVKVYDVTEKAVVQVRMGFHC
jgi:polycomb protein EED